MAWDRVIAQDRVKQVLHQAISSNRVAHAYLFHGPYGTGKRAMAFALARALQCQARPGEGCGECAVCDRIDRMLHPDVRFLMPAPKDAEPDEYRSRMEALGANPYETVDYLRRPTAKTANKQAIYPKDVLLGSIRPVVDFMSFEGGHKLVILLDAEVLGEEIGNAFLKLLEEPSRNTVFVLISERPEQLLPTIMSRCQPIRFDPIPADDIAKTLVAKEGMEAHEAASVARLSDGSFSVARDLIHDESAREFRSTLVPFLRAIYANKVDDVMVHVENISSRTRDQIKLFLGLMIVLIRDLILVRELGENAPVVNVGEKEALLKFSRNLQSARLEQMVDLVEEGWYLITRNVRPDLILMSLSAALRASMNGRPALPLVTPLAEQILSDMG